MPRRSFDDLLRSLSKGELAPVYYLHGSEAVLKEEVVDAIVAKALDPAERDFNLERRDAAGLDPEALHTVLNTLPMLAARRVVVVTGIEAWKRKTAVRSVLLKYLENPSSETVVVLLQGGKEREGERGGDDADGEIEARTVSVDVRPLEPERVVRWIGRQAERAGFTLGPGAVEHLAIACDHDLGLIRTELEKLAALEDTEPVSRERVEALVGIRQGETLQDWVTAVLGDDPVRALALTSVVLEQGGMSGVRMVAALGTQLAGVALARGLRDQDQRGRLEQAIFERLLRARPFGLGDWKKVAAQWARWAPAWPPARTDRAFSSALAADQSLKSTRFTDELGVLQQLVLLLADKDTSGPAGAGAALAVRME